VARRGITVCDSSFTLPHCWFKTMY
jgi:hypothetical protein